MPKSLRMAAITVATISWLVSMMLAPSAQAADLLTTVTQAKTSAPESIIEKIAISTDKKKDNTPVIEEPAPQSDKPTVITHVVQPGEYLEKIARQHNIGWPSIYELNDGITNPDIIYPYQKLEVPEHDIPLTRQLPEDTTLKVPDDYKPQTISAQKTSVTVASTPVATLATVVTGRLGIGNALAYVGYPYRYGGTTPAGFDCSGFTQFIAGQQGIKLPRTVMAQYSATTRISKGELRPGDLVFFNAHHVGIYIGGGQIIHAATPALGVRIDSLASAIAYNGYLGAGRL